jgi:hypothetical protein
MGVLFLLFHVVSEHPVNIVSVAFGDFHAGGAHFVNSRIGVSIHILVPSKSTGVSSIAVGRLSRSLTSLQNSVSLSQYRQACSWVKFHILDRYYRAAASWRRTKGRMPPWR